MGRPHNLEPLPQHPSVGTDYRMMSVRKDGVRAYCAAVTCPHCAKVRWWPLNTLRQQLKRENFNGQCFRCGQIQGRAGWYKWAKRNGLERRSINNNGYVLLGPTAIPIEDLPIFRAMQNNNNAVLEHRFVMAKKLGRPLQPNECIDHMDGNKTNNDPSNLRLYVKGKNQPGSGIGYGTYYHEWQMALAEIRRLESLLD